MALSSEETVRQAVDIALRSVAGYLLGEAAKYGDPEERDYRDGIRYAASVIDQIVTGRLRATVLGE